MDINSDNNSGKKFNFDSFSNLDFYRNVNSQLLDLADIDKSKKIVDLGCGNGGITEMILSKVSDVSKVVIYAVDSSSTMLSLDLKRFGDRKDVLGSKAELLVLAGGEPLNKLENWKKNNFFYKKELLTNSIVVVSDKKLNFESIDDICGGQYSIGIADPKIAPLGKYSIEILNKFQASLNKHPYCYHGGIRFPPGYSVCFTALR